MYRRVFVDIQKWNAKYLTLDTQHCFWYLLLLAAKKTTRQINVDCLSSWKFRRSFRENGDHWFIHTMFTHISKNTFFISHLFTPQKALKWELAHHTSISPSLSLVIIMEDFSISPPHVPKSTDEIVIAHVDCILIPYYHANYIPYIATVNIFCFRNSLTIKMIKIFILFFLLSGNFGGIR